MNTTSLLLAGIGISMITSTLGLIGWDVIRHRRRMNLYASEMLRRSMERLNREGIE